MGDLEERARRRLDLEEVRQRRVALELELEARRKAAQAAQHKLTEIAGAEGQVGDDASKLRPGGADQSADHTREDDLEPDASQSHAIINERLAQRRREREEQHQAAARKLEALNAKRWELQKEQVALEKLKASVAAEAAREAEEAEAAAREMEAALSIVPEEKPQSQPGDIAVADEEAESERQSKGVVQLHVLAPADLARRVGEAVPQQQAFIDDLQREKAATDKQVRQDLPRVPILNPRMRPEQVVTSESVAAHQQRWEESGEALNRHLRKEAFEKAIRKQMQKIIEETVLMMVSDVAAESSFARFWAEQTAGSLIVDALLSRAGAPRGRPELTQKQVREKTNSLIHILSDYRRRRGLKKTMHVHSVAPVHPDLILAKESGKKDDAAEKAEQVIDADQLLLYMDMPATPADEALSHLLVRERAHWRGVEALPIFLTGLPEGVEIAQPSPDANQLAMSLVKSQGILVYDIRHLPPRMSRKRVGWGSKVKDLAWSADSTRLVTLDEASAVAVWSVRADKDQNKEGIFSKSGDQNPLNLVLAALFEPLFDLKAKPAALTAQELANLLDVSTPRSYTGSAVAFHPCMTVAGLQPCVMLGVQGGVVVKFNSKLTDKAVFAKCSVEPETADVEEGGGGGPVAEGSVTPRREYFVRHQAAIRLVAPLSSGEEMVTLDDDGLLCIWHYAQAAFSSMGWFTPKRAVKLVVADAVFSDDHSVEKETVFPEWVKGAGPDPDLDRQAFQERSEEHAARLRDAYSIDTAKPFEVKVWREETWAGRRKEGTTAIHKGADIDSVTGRAYFHSLKYSQEGLLLSHVTTVRSREVSQGLVLRARPDYSGRRLVLLCYLPPGGPRRHGHIASIFRVDLTDPISLMPPRIDMQLPEATCKAIDKKMKRAPASAAERQAVLRQVLQGVDFDIAPPQGSTGAHVAHVLLGNKVYSFSLESGQEVMEPLDPLAAQKRRGLLSSIRCVAKFDSLAGGRDPFAPPPEAHEDPDTPSSYEHLVICTSRDAPTAFMYSIEPAGGGQPGGVSPAASSRLASRGELEEQGALVAEAHRREKTRAATVQQQGKLKTGHRAGGVSSLGGSAVRSREGR